ncbi:class F sortase [Ornithinimicrobium tianjinense]|uniref:Sortase family protein n=1 Tax=Ornithinimicrobium tianjinense TaxID=1195761 RepID=A0A917F7B5_9MICO|nr:class F sortase [Ornithinimicrobium tianjinense]GGF54297.1 hypothetical protein GCM10011366_22700 [Ornithinimicrobium tianjinense]
MTLNRPEGDRAGRGAVPPLVLIIGGLLVAAVAVLALVLQSGGGSDDDAAASTSPTVELSVETAEPTPSASASPSATTASRSAEPSPTPTASPSPSPSGNAGQAQGAPAWIRITAGGVDAPLVPQGLAPDGTINPGRNEVIWFTGSNRVSPGQVGTAVIAAHVTWEGQPDAFVNLTAVGPGDVVEVGYDDGTSRSFTVTQAVPVDKDQLARSLTVWGDHPDHPRLAIITCDDTQGFQPDGHTAANYVVIAEG